MNKWDSEKERSEWKAEAKKEKRRILLNKELYPCEILIRIFEWSIDNYDENCLETELPCVYSVLKTLYDSNEDRPIKDNLEENFVTINEVIWNFELNKIKIKKQDTYLYYALLGFIDFLKTSEGHRIYYRMK